MASLLTTSNDVVDEKKTIAKNIFSQLLENPEMAAVAVNKLFPIISKKLPSLNKKHELLSNPATDHPIPIFSCSEDRNSSSKLWDKIINEFRVKDFEMLGKYAVDICKEMENIHNTIQPIQPEIIASEITTKIIRSIDEHQSKKVEASVTIDPTDYYLTIPFQTEYISSMISPSLLLATDNNESIKDLHITIKYDLTMRELASLLGKRRNIQIKGIYDAFHAAGNPFDVPEGKYSALVVSVDENMERPDGAVYHMTISSPVGAASNLGKLCKVDTKNIKSIQPSCAGFYGYICLMKKKSQHVPVHIGLDVDDTTFGCKKGIERPMLESGEIDFKKFNTPEWTMENYTGLPLLQILNQLPQECIHFITNRRTNEPEIMGSCFNTLATSFLGRATNFHISFEPEKIRGNPKTRKIGKANSKQTRLLKATSGNIGILFDDECVPYLTSPNVIGIDVLKNQKVRIVESTKRPLVISCQGCVASGKTTVWKSVEKLLKTNKVNGRYLAADQLSDIAGGCYRYVEGIIPTLDCDVLIFDTTCASGKPDFVDIMFQQKIPDPDAYITMCFERLVQRIGHPTLNSPVADFLGVATVSNDFADMPLFQLMQKLYVEQGGFDGMKNWFGERGFDLRERTYGTVTTVIVAYKEYAQVWTKWGRQARGFKVILGQNKKPLYVACEQLQRGTELVTSNTANVEGDVENYKYQEHFSKEQQVLLKTLRSTDNSTPLKLLSVGKDDGMLCSVVLVPKIDKCYKSYVEIMNNDHTQFAQTMLKICEELPFIIVFQSQKTMITGDMVNCGVVTSLQQVFFPSMTLDKDKPPKDLIQNVIKPFLNILEKFYKRVSPTMNGKKVVLMFECCTKGAKDYQGLFHWELTANGPESQGSFRLLGINFEDENNWNYIPSAVIEESIRDIFEPLGMPAGFVTKTVGDLNEVINALTQCIRGEISLEQYIAIASRFCTFGEPGKLSPEGFVVFEIGEDYNGFGLVGLNYNKVKVAEYYICHKWEKYLFDILSLSDSVASSVSRWFGSVYFVRKLFKCLPEKLTKLLEEGDKYLCPTGEHYDKTKEQLHPKAATAAKLAQQENNSSNQKKKKRNKKKKNLYEIFIQNIETRNPDKIRGFLTNNDGPRQYIYNNLLTFCINEFDLKTESVDEYKEILISLCHKLLVDDIDTITERLKIVDSILQKKDKDIEDYKALQIARNIQNLYPYFKRGD